MYAARWEKLVSERTSFDVVSLVDLCDELLLIVAQVEIVSWNDYGESHYIGPIEGALPLNAGDWVNGFPHTGLCPYTSVSGNSTYTRC